jgi:hypothetical protein
LPLQRHVAPVKTLGDALVSEYPKLGAERRDWA